MASNFFPLRSPICQPSSPRLSGAGLGPRLGGAGLGRRFFGVGVGARAAASGGAGCRRSSSSSSLPPMRPKQQPKMSAPSKSAIKM